jgi:hypothetical protein
MNKFKRQIAGIEKATYSMDKDLREGSVKLEQVDLSREGDTFGFITIESRNGDKISLSDFDSLQALHKVLGMAIEACHASPAHKA